MWPLRVMALSLALSTGVFLAFPQTAAAQTSTKANTLELQVQPVSFVPFLSYVESFGKLTWRGGLHLKSADKRFGGFSGLAISRDGKRVVSISDDGWWLTAKLGYTAGKLRAVSSAEMGPLRDRKGRRPGSKWRRDAEALAPMGARTVDGTLLVGYESRVRIEAFRVHKQGFSSRPKPVRFPREIARGPRNKQLEGLGRFWEGPLKGWLIATSELNLDKAGNIRGWAWRGKHTRRFSLRRFDDYSVTDLAILPGGEQFVTLERSFPPSQLVGMAVRRFQTSDLKDGTIVDGELLFSGRVPFYTIDNMEGIAAHRADDGELRLTMISDDNFNRTVQRTLLLQFAVTD